MSRPHTIETRLKIGAARKAWLAAHPDVTSARDRKILELRREGIKQEAIAAECGLTQSRVSQILRRSERP